LLCLSVAIVGRLHWFLMLVMLLRLLILFFFVMSYCHHRDLHSFPTRRSSDLAGQASRDRAACPARDLVSHRAARVADRPAAPNRDRKSTRLNSSHQIISYAVFCLKKKTKKPNTNPASQSTKPRPESTHPHHPT